MVCYSIVVESNLYSDWSKHECGRFIARTDLHCDWSFQIPVVNSS